MTLAGPVCCGPAGLAKSEGVNGADGNRATLFARAAADIYREGLAFGFKSLFLRRATIRRAAAVRGGAGHGTVARSG